MQRTPEIDSKKPQLNEKLQKVLARAGLGSRREMEKAITDGRVSVNGKPAKLGDRVTARDKIEFAGTRVRTQEQVQDQVRILLYNKPEGEICSRKDPEGRPTVFDRLPPIQNGRWVSVGRLDFNTSGLLLFTNNGELANQLMHPSSNIDREYLVRVQGEVTNEILQNLRNGVELEDGLARFTDIAPGNKKTDNERGNHWFYCVVMEGRNREVRRLWESQDLRVSRLKRVRFGNIFIPSHVRVGQWLEFEEQDIHDLYLTAGLEPPPRASFSPRKSQERERHQKRLRGSATPKGRTPKSPSSKKPFSKSPSSKNSTSAKKRSPRRL